MSRPDPDARCGICGQRCVGRAELNRHEAACQRAEDARRDAILAKYVEEKRVAKALGATLIPGSATVTAEYVVSAELIGRFARAAIEAIERDHDIVPKK